MTPIALLSMQKEEDRKKAESKLVENGFRVISFADNVQILKSFYQNENSSLVVLDSQLEKTTQYRVCREINESRQNTAILITNCENENDELYGLSNGADDCVRKPLNCDLLMLKIKNSILKVGGNDLSDIKLNGITLSYKRYLLEIDGQEVRLTPREFDLLYYLVKNRNQMITRYQILYNVWEVNYSGNERTVDTHIKTLRKKLGPYRNNLITIREVGYKFIWKCD